jgi:hypothetical protein
MPTPRLSRESSNAASPLKLGALSSENRASLGKLEAGGATNGSDAAPKLPTMPVLRTENVNPALQTPPRASMVARRSMMNGVMPAGGPPSPPSAPHPLMQGSVQAAQTNSAGGMRLPQMTHSASSLRASSPPPLFPKRTSMGAGSGSGTHTPPASAAAIAGDLQLVISTFRCIATLPPYLVTNAVIY